MTTHTTDLEVQQAERQVMELREYNQDLAIKHETLLRNLYKADKPTGLARHMLKLDLGRYKANICEHMPDNPDVYECHFCGFIRKD